MARYIEANDLVRKMTLQANKSSLGEIAPPSLSYSEMLEIIADAPTVDVVPKREYDAIAEKNESLEIELENMRRNLGDAREGWNDAECEVERLREINSLLTEAGQEWQKRYNNAKAEVAREIFEEIEKVRSKEIHRCEVIRESEKDPTERKYWEGGEHSLRQLSYWFAELKKKYTEESAE